MAVQTGSLATAAAAPPRVWTWDRPVQWLLTVVATVLVVFPLAPILFQSVLDRPLYESDRAFTLSNYGRILGSAEFRATLGTTLVFGLLTTILAVVIGTALAVLLTRTDLP